MAQPNGLAFSPDGRKLYVDDSERKEIRVWDVTRDGGVRNGRLFGKLDGPGDPDGMRVDTLGNLYVTGQSGIWVWDASRHSPGHHRAPGTDRKSNLGRSRLRNALHHLQHVGAKAPYEGQWVRPV